VKETLRNGLVLVEFRNGHRVVAHLTRRDRVAGRQFAPDETVTVEMTPFDFSHGRIRSLSESKI
jgi:translation initiation factor IF-1